MTSRMSNVRRMLTLVLLLVAVSDHCHAQGLFGDRQLGRAVNKRSAPQSTGPDSGVTTGRRFLRDERSVTDFVGSAIAQEAAGNFVGGQSAASTAVSSIVGLTEEARPVLNRPRFVRPSGMYAERLKLTADSLPPSGSANDVFPISDSTAAIIQARSLTIEVSPEGNSAILLGSVPSEHDRQMTELLVKLEPGIQTVENRLTVDPSLPPLPRASRRSGQRASN